MTPPLPLLRRRDASQYLKDRHGLSVATATLDKLASIGGGPPIRYFGRIPMYAPEALDAWALAKLEPPVRSTAERVRG